MPERVVYLKIPVYLAQWYAYRCREHYAEAEGISFLQPYTDLTPIRPIKDSQVSRILKYYLRQRPSASLVRQGQEVGNATLAIQIPTFKHIPETYNYVSDKTKELIVQAIRTEFDMCLWEELYNLHASLKRTDKTIEAFMDNHGITYDDTNWNAIAKRYQRLRNNHKQTKSRKNAQDFIG